MKKVLLLMALCCIYITGKAQKKDSAVVDLFNPADKITLNFGLGFEVGGIGMNALYYPVKQVGVFAGVGYAFTNMGYSLGTKLRWFRRDSLSVAAPFILAMYGYHASVKVQNAEHLNKTFYGPSFGIGIDSPAKKGFYWSFSINRRLNHDEVKDYVNYLEKNGVVFKQAPFPFTLSVTLRTIIL